MSMGFFTIRRFFLAAASIVLVYFYVRFPRKVIENRIKNIEYHDVLNPPVRKISNLSHELLVNYDDVVFQENLESNNEEIHEDEIDENSKEGVQALLESNKKRFYETRVNCSAIISGDSVETKRANKLEHHAMRPANESSYWDRHARLLVEHLEETSDCDRFISRHGVITSSLTEEEERFPIAFSILTYWDIDLFVRMLTAIYRPQNFYCVHVDLTSSPDYHQIVTNIAGCLPNIIKADPSLNITWGNWSIVQAEINCMQSLYKYKTWRYFINLTGQEFPLKTNFELVQILKSFRGANDVDGGVKRRRFFRWKMSPTPAGITPYQGSTHIAVNREFVTFILFNETSEAIQTWLRPTKVPDETFFATLNHNPQLHIRGSFTGDLKDVEERYGAKPSFTRYKQWSDVGICALKHHWHRGVCVLSVGDLPRMTRSIFMFANKFMPHKHPLAVTCLHEWLANRTMDFYTGSRQVRTSYYERSTIVKNQIL